MSTDLRVGELILSVSVTDLWPRKSGQSNNPVIEFAGALCPFARASVLLHEPLSFCMSLCPFAWEGNQDVMLAIPTLPVHEAVGKDAALEVVVEPTSP